MQHRGSPFSRTCACQYLGPACPKKHTVVNERASSLPRKTHYDMDVVPLHDSERRATRCPCDSLDLVLSSDGLNQMSSLPPDVNRQYLEYMPNPYLDRPEFHL